MNQIRIEDSINEESKMDKDNHKSSGSVKKRSGVLFSKSNFETEQ